MIELKLNRYAKKVDNFLLNFLKRQSKSLLVSPMKYGAISGGKENQVYNNFLILGKYLT